MNHTPGPWAVRKGYGMATFTVVDADGTGVADLWAKAGDTTDEVEGANAALIAAAPDMLAALQQIKQALGCRDFIRIEGDLCGQIIAGEAFAAVDAAIAKATNTQRTPNGTIKDGTWTPDTKATPQS